MAIDLRGLIRGLRGGEDARFTAACARALRGLEGGNIHGELLKPGPRALARGVLTARVLSVSRDRPWPYAFVRQLDPEDPGFLPLSLLPIHLNLAYRNWTTVGLPDRDEEAIVDPGGWLTPSRDGPSVAVWVGDSRRLLTLGPLPGWGRDEGVSLDQGRFKEGPFIRTVGRRDDLEVEVDAFPAVVQGRRVFGLTARVRLLAPAPRPVRFGFSIRPANPEGVAPIFDLHRREDGWWFVDGRPFLYVPHPGHERALSTWKGGDVYGALGGVLRDGRPLRGPSSDLARVSCSAGMAQGAELYRFNLSPGETAKRTVWAAEVEELGEVLRRTSATSLVAGAAADWEGVTQSGGRVELPVHDELLRSCRATLLALIDRVGVTPGPATEHRFTFRHAARHLGALTRLGYGRRAAALLRAYPGRQSRSGAWSSTAGGQDGTGQALRTIVDHVRLTGDLALLRQLWPSISKGAAWIARSHADGLMPTGATSGLGPSDHYFQDALWSCAGLREASLAARWLGHTDEERAFGIAHGELLEKLRARIGPGPVPAAPGRSMDSAAVSVLCAVWPLGLLEPSEPSMRRTVRWLLEHCMYGAGLFHDVVHSGVNPALTALLAQVRLAAGDPEALRHLDHLAELASPTGTWPEALHPRRGGVMGDGDHAGAAAEFVMLCRNLVLWEGGADLHLFRGADRRWFEGVTVLERLPTRFGAVDLELRDGRLRLFVDWRTPPARVVWHKPEGEPGELVVNGERVEGEDAELVLPGG